MFAYLRHFFLFSTLVVILATIFMGWYAKSTSYKIITSQAKQVSVAIADSYKKTLWAQYASDGGFKDLIFHTTAEDRKLSLTFTQLAKDTKSFVDKSSVVQFNIYVNKIKAYEDKRNSNIKVNDLATNRLSLFLSIDRSGKLVTTQDNILAALGAVNEPFNTSAKEDDIKSEVVNDAKFFQNRVMTEGVLIRTLIPVYFTKNSGDEADAIIEIYYDATPEHATLLNFQYIAICLILGIFVVMLVTLIYISGRAEKTIIRQHDTTSELMAAKIKAEASNEQKNQFLASISHELRTPLNAIIGFSEIIKDEVMGPVQNEQYRNYIKDIHGSGVHLLSLINDILDFSKAEAGKLDVEYEDIDLNKLIASTLRLQEPRAQTGNVRLEQDLPTEHIVMHTDNKRLKQILLNLLSNAVKFTPPEGKVKVSAWNDIVTGNVHIEVADSGIGIAPKDLAKAMSPFGQISSDLSRRYEGTGLGLPLTKKFTELLGGVMDIESEVGKGTKIRITLPRTKEGKGTNKAVF